MSETPRLLPNLGAEEEGDWRQTLRTPRVALAARLWRWLFPARARVVGEDQERTPIDWQRWPRALEANCEEAAFDWLAGASGCVPWLADAQARTEAARLGLALPGPAPEVVAHVHDKAFAWRAAESAGLVPKGLSQTTLVLEPSDLEQPASALAAVRSAVDSWPDWTGGRFSLKPRFGTSGRGRIDGQADALDAVDLTQALARLARHGGALLEPWLDRIADLSAQVRLSATEGVVMLGSLELLTGPAGGYRGHAGEIDSRGRVSSGHVHDEALREAVVQIALEAGQAGFHGPAGLDALVYRETPETEPTLRPCVEWNARFTMGTVVLGLLRRLLPRLRSELDLGPGERRAFTFLMDPPRMGWERAQEVAGRGSLLIPLSCPGDALEPAVLFAPDRAGLRGLA